MSLKMNSPFGFVLHWTLLFLFFCFPAFAEEEKEEKKEFFEFSYSFGKIGHGDAQFLHPHGMAFSPDGTRLATGGFDGQVRLYRAADCALEKAFVPVPIAGGGVQ